MKKGVKLTLALIFSIFFLMQFVYAIDTEIKVKTLPNHEVQLTTFKANTVDFIIIDKFIEDSDEYGDISFTTSTEESEFNIVVYIKKDDVKIMGPEKFLDQPSGEPIYLEIYPNWYTPIEAPTNETNETEEISNETEVLEESTEISDDNKTDQDSVTGLAISEDELSSNKTLYYGMGVLGFLLVGFAAFIVVQKTKSRRRMRGMEKLDDILDNMDPQEKKKKSKKDLMEDVKKKMKDIESEIDELKGE